MGSDCTFQRLVFCLKISVAVMVELFTSLAFSRFYETWEEPVWYACWLMLFRWDPYLMKFSKARLRVGEMIGSFFGVRENTGFT